MLIEVVVGVIGRAHGIRGEVTVEPRTDEPERRFAVGAVLRAESGAGRFTVAARRWQETSSGRRLLVRFDEIADRTAAEQGRGTVLMVDVDEAERPDEPEEFYDRQLVGLRVRDAAGTDRGEVIAIRHVPAQDLLEVATEAGVRLVPFVTAIVPVVDVDAGWVSLADLPGLLADADSNAAADGDAPGAS